MLARHELFKKKYPDMPNGHGIPYTGLSNARPETKAIAERVKRTMESMPFDVTGVTKHPLTSPLAINGGRVYKLNL